MIFGYFLVLIFAPRFFIEFIKVPQVGFEEQMMLNMGQWLSIPLVLGGAALMYWSSKQKAKPIS